MASLLNLPIEVFDFIYVDLDTFSKVKLSMTCKSFHASLETLIYKSLLLSYETGDYHPRCLLKEATPPQQSRQSIRKLMRTLLQSPKHARATERLELHESGFLKDFRKGQDDIDETEDLPVPDFTDALHNARLSLRDLPDDVQFPYNGRRHNPCDRVKWSDGVKEQQINVCLALTILQCKNLVSLSIGTSHSGLCYIGSLMTYLIHEDKASIDHFPSLRLVSLETNFDQRFWEMEEGLWGRHVSDVETFLPFFYIAPLTELQCCLPVSLSEEIIEWPIAHPPVLDRLKTLNLHRSGALPESLEKILQAMPSLSELQYDLLVELRPTESNVERLHCWALQRAFDKVKGSLQRLKLSLQITSDYDLWDIWHLNDDGIKGHLDFCKFLEMRDLEVSTILLLGSSNNRATRPALSSLLPPQLQRITLRDDLAFQQIYPWRSGILIPAIRTFLTEISLSSHISLGSLTLFLSESGPNPYFYPEPIKEVHKALKDWNTTRQEEFHQIFRQNYGTRTHSSAGSQRYINSHIEFKPVNPYQPYSQKAMYELRHVDCEETAREKHWPEPAESGSTDGDLCRWHR